MAAAIVGDYAHDGSFSYRIEKPSFGDTATDADEITEQVLQAVHEAGPDGIECTRALRAAGGANVRATDAAASSRRCAASLLERITHRE